MPMRLLRKRTDLEVVHWICKKKSVLGISRFDLWFDLWYLSSYSTPFTYLVKDMNPIILEGCR
jgi:hypothetical protein